MAAAAAGGSPQLSPPSSSPGQVIPDSDSAAPLASLAAAPGPASPSPVHSISNSNSNSRAVKRPRLTLSPEPGLPNPAPHQTAVPSASQDLAFLQQLDLETLDWQPSSDPAPHRSSPVHPRPRPPLHVPATTATTRSVRTDASLSNSKLGAFHRLDAADDSGVFLDTVELNLSQDMDLAGGDEILLALGGEEGDGYLDGDGASEEDEMWAGFDEPEVEADETAGLELPPPPPQDQNGEEMDYNRADEGDGFDFSLGAAGTQGAQGWDPNMLGGFQLASRKPVKMSEEALRRAKRLLEAELEENDEEGQVMSPRALDPIASTSGLATTFSTGSGHPILAPTSASLAQAAELLGHLPSNSTINTTSTSTLTTVPLPLASIRTLPPPHLPSFAPSAFAGFTTAGGTPVAAPSEAALTKARGQVFSSPPPAAVFGTGGAAPSQIQSFGGFMTAGGEKVDMPSEEALERARKSAEKDEFGAGVGEGGSPAPRKSGEGRFKLPGGAQRFALVEELEGSEVGKSMESPTTRRSDSSEGRRTPLLPVNDLNIALVEGGRPSSPHPHPSSPASSSRPPSRSRHSIPSAEPIASTFAAVASPPQLPSNNRRLPPSRTTLPSNALVTPLPSRLKPSTSNTPIAFRSPLLSSTTRTPRPSSFRPPLLHNSNSNSTTPQKLSSTPLQASTHRRLNLGMTPRARPAPGTPGSRQKKFETPFKGGKRPLGLTPVGLVGRGVSGGAGGAPGGGEVGGKGKGKEKARAVKSDTKEGGGELIRLFDLTALPDRLSLSEFGMRPQTHYYESCEQLGVPSEILNMTLSLAWTYAFLSTQNAPPFSHPEAQVALLSSGANPTFATPAWVKNHYGLIVWKLASYVRSRPDLLASWWTWEKVMEGLKYRYEREVNQAHRSAIKRIQEQDSPSTLPMVLCVSQLRWDDSPEVDPLTNPGAEDQPLVIVGLELTDGWYRVRTNVDLTLRKAVERGKIVVGSKLVVVGAKIDSSREGTEVLEALGKSSLIISGNSTTLAPWSTRLGFLPPSSGPFVASLSSLTSSGGVASLLDVVVEKAFPCGFVDLGKGGGHGTWNEEEERARKDEWVKGRAKAQARLADEMAKTSNEWEEIIELLQDCVQRVGAASTASPSPSLDEEEPDEILDRLEGASTIKEKDAILRNLSPRQANGALKLAGEMAVQARYAAQEELEKELATAFPPRDVRGFRVLRIKDARVGSKPFASKRTAQLTVWDADSLGADFFLQGARYFVTNVIPKGSWKRQSEEITLATRRDSRWRAVVVGPQQG